MKEENISKANAEKPEKKEQEEQPEKLVSKSTFFNHKLP